ncbi:hypothetical protein MHYP_G00024270, partial [Metynnis hypsauchen]
MMATALMLVSWPNCVETRYLTRLTPLKSNCMLNYAQIASLMQEALWHHTHP